MSEESEFKVKSGGGAFAKYRSVYYGEQPVGKVLLGELLTLLIGNLPGALGLFLRMKLYPLMFESIGSKVVFGRGVTLRHAHKIQIGNDVVIDDHAVIDAKGKNNQGIVLGDSVYIGRNTIVYCKGGDIELKEKANLSSNCQVFSSNSLTIGKGCMIGAYSYLLSGGEYDGESDVPFAEQDGMETKGPLTLGDNCWLGARVTVLDGASVGGHSILAAGAVVTKPFPENSVLGGVPAKVLKERAGKV